MQAYSEVAIEQQVSIYGSANSEIVDSILAMGVSRLP